jgi:chemotaxis protein methyltransferase CheR
MPGTETMAQAPTLSAEDFSRVRRIAYQRAGLAIPAGKEGLVRSRVSRRLRERRIATFAEYLNTVEKEGGEEMVKLIDLLTTNKTDFFREMAHFDYLRQTIVPRVASSGKPMRVWSAGCSSGEEPYTLSMVLHEALPARHEFRILATDISTQVVAAARKGVYAEAQLSDVSPERRAKWFSPTPDGGGAASNALRAPISFANLNLMAPWPMTGPFDLILCRNVMIYFDKPTITTLVNRYYDLLTPGGHLFIGHSESLTAVDHRYRYVQPAVYQK